MPRKPDRWERIADNMNGGHISPEAWAYDMRKEHRWVERMVRKVDAWACQELADNDDIIAAILEQLKQRRK